MLIMISSRVPTRAASFLLSTTQHAAGREYENFSNMPPAAATGTATRPILKQKNGSDVAH